MYSQNTQAVHSRDALAVPQQIAAVQTRGKQELLPRLPADFAMIHSHRLHGLGNSWEDLGVERQWTDATAAAAAAATQHESATRLPVQPDVQKRERSARTTGCCLPA